MLLEEHELDAVILNDVDRLVAFYVVEETGDELVCLTGAVFAEKV